MNIIQARAAIIMLSILLLSHWAAATPRPMTVVADHGGTPAQPYYESLGFTPLGTSLNPSGSLPPEVSSMSSGFGRPVSSGPSNRKDFESAIEFRSVRSTRLTPGPVTRRAATFSSESSLAQPFFLIGDDPLSRRWLRERYETIKRLGAVGLVVNVEAQEGLLALQKLVPGLTLSAVPGDDLAEKLRLDHYPVLITASGIEQ